MNPYLNIIWLADNPDERWRSSRDAILDYYRVQTHAIEHDRLDHKEARPLIDQPSESNHEAWQMERNFEDWGTWDFYFEDTFSQLLRISTVTLLCARVSEWSSFFCDYMRRRRKTTATFRDIRKKDWHLDQHLRYLRLIHDCAIDPSHNRVTTLRQYFVLRNAIVHERVDASALKPLQARAEIGVTESSIHIQNSAIQACATAATEFVDYLMGICATRLTSDSGVV